MNGHCHGVLNRAILHLLPYFAPKSRLAVALATEAETPISLPAAGRWPGFDGPLIEAAGRAPDMVAMKGNEDAYLHWANHHWSPNPRIPDAHRLIPAGRGSIAWEGSDLPKLLGPGNTGDLPWAVALYARRLSEQTCNPLYTRQQLAWDTFFLLHFGGGDAFQIPHTSGDHAADASYHHSYEGEAASAFIDELDITAGAVSPYVAFSLAGDITGWYQDSMADTAMHYPEWLAAYEAGGRWREVEHLFEQSVYRAVAGGISLLMHLERTAKNPDIWGGRIA